MERGRLRRSSGDETVTLPLFERAFAIASASGETFLAVDAAHMAAIVATTVADREEWAHRGIALAVAESAAPDGWFHHELAESSAAVGDEKRAAEHARIVGELRPAEGY